ncbi:MAG: serine protease [Pseudomonadota bacterium]
MHIGFSFGICFGLVFMLASTDAAWPQDAVELDHITARLVVAEEALEKLKVKGKDVWDKLQAASGLITGGLVALVVFIATQWLNHRQTKAEVLRKEELASAERLRAEELRASDAIECERDRVSQESQSDRDAQILKVQTVQGLIPHLASEEPRMVSAALIAVHALGDKELFTRLARLSGRKGSLDAIFRVASQEEDALNGNAELAIGQIISGYQSSIVKICDDYGRAIGTGFFVGDGSSIITARHVIAQANDHDFRAKLDIGSLPAMVAQTTAGQGFAAKTHAISDEFDLALLKVDDTGSTHLPVDADSKPSLFSKVAVLGIPGGRSLTARLGEITSTEAVFTETHHGMLEFRMISEPGMSGSPVINSEGNVVGVLVGSDRRRELTYAVPIGLAEDAFQLR